MQISLPNFVRRRDRLQNWLDCYQLKCERQPEKRPTVKGFMGFGGERVDTVDYYKYQIKEFDTRMTLETHFPSLEQLTLGNFPQESTSKRLSRTGSLSKWYFPPSLTSLDMEGDTDWKCTTGGISVYSLAANSKFIPFM
ncbi:calcium permeable stress-gated cation channel 1 [Quillaja saponaria]|uniref:Calcium permeable stress-gated cation channel 1 n=1 Tax=Quillaja saponaria TaxID=32244 RepID=A0AAD7P6N8_QUISA|nr:calcium permeable stress-gated cation channel 1 [Quillaja saponaria]